MHIVSVEPETFGETYEGQIKDGMAHGLGISFNGIDTYLIGRRSKGTREGLYIVLDSEGIYEANFANGNLINGNTRGFAPAKLSPDLMMMREYINVLLPDTTIGTSDSKVDQISVSSPAIVD